MFIYNLKSKIRLFISRLKLSLNNKSYLDSFSSIYNEIELNESIIDKDELIKEINNFRCPICKNTDARYIGINNGKLYCRRCIEFKLNQVDINYKVNKDKALLDLKFPLSEKQKKISEEVLNSLINKKNVLICAVTGAGKTELVYSSFQYYLERGLHVGFATPRKDVVVDLLPRIQEAFPLLKVISVYGGNNSLLEGDIVVLTSHQLCHYKNYFDLIVMDEIDAFPYKNDYVLNNFFKESCKGNYILLSATASENDRKKILEDNGVILELNSRYHTHDLIVPKFEYINIFTSLYKLIKLLKKYISMNKQVFVFVSTTSLAKRLYFIVSLFVKQGNYVSSKVEKREKIISDFKKKKYSYLITTSILERGVTVKNLYVIIFDADSNLYDKESLIQIAGRVGRKIDSYNGEVIFYGRRKTESIEQAIETIENTNRRKNL